MKTVVLDSSVITKWFFPEKKEEKHLTQSLQLLKLIQRAEINIIQPPHWLAEVAGVIVRIESKVAKKAVDLLNAMDFNISSEIDIYYTACELSKDLNHHLFDTLYHAVALHQKNVQFITADEKYFKKAYGLGGIIRLADFNMFEEIV